MFNNDNSDFPTSEPSRDELPEDPIVDSKSTKNKGKRNKKKPRRWSSRDFFSDLILDLVSQSWTLVGLTVAWLVLEGSAKVLTGNLIVATLVVWVLTFPLRHRKK